MRFHLLVAPVALSVSFGAAAIPHPNASRPSSGTARSIAPIHGRCIALDGRTLIVRLGDGTVRNGPHDGPLRAIPGISSAVAVAIGEVESIVLLADGSVVAIGANNYPVKVEGLGKVADIAAWGDRFYAVMADGTVREWDTKLERKGIGVNSRDRKRPKPVPGISNAVAIAASRTAAFALLADGTIRSWGENHFESAASGGRVVFGVLGTGNERDESSPVQVLGITNAVALSVGEFSAAAILADGTLKAWGQNQSLYPWSLVYFEVPGVEPHSLVPITLPKLEGAIATSEGLTLFPDGTVREWWNVRYPVDPVAGITNAVAVATTVVPRRRDAPPEIARALFRRNFALLADGKLIAWWHESSRPQQRKVVAELGVQTAEACAAPKSFAPPMGAPAVVAQQKAEPRRYKSSSGATYGSSSPEETARLDRPTFQGTITAVKNYADPQSPVQEIYTYEVTFELSPSLDNATGSPRPGASKLRWEVRGTDRYGCTYRGGPATFNTFSLELEGAGSIQAGAMYRFLGGLMTPEPDPEPTSRLTWYPTAELLISCPNGFSATHRVSLIVPLQFLHNVWHELGADPTVARGSKERPGEKYTWNLRLNIP